MLEQRARLDGLTGLANGGVLEDRLPREWEACRRRGTPLAVVISDLDHFKAINDTHGHAAGDEVFRQAASTLARAVRSSDLVARYGGEEFVVVAPDCDLLRRPGRPNGSAPRSPSSRSSSTGPRFRSPRASASRPPYAGDVTSAELLRQADEALYRAKDSGRDATWFWNQSRRGPAPCEASFGPREHERAESLAVGRRPADAVVGEARAAIRAGS